MFDAARKKSSDFASKNCRDVYKRQTLHAFLTAMLLGLEKGRGRAKGTEGYLRYEPWHAPSYYSGALQFSVGGRPFYLERNFYHKEPRARLCNLADGEELSVAYGDLGMLLGGVTREAYENTCDIPQCRAVTGAELTGLLAEYLSDLSLIHIFRSERPHLR